MEENDYKSVVNDLKLANGLIFGLPVVFDTDDVRVVPGATVLLQYKNVPIAVFHVSYEDFIIASPVEVDQRSLKFILVSIYFLRDFYEIIDWLNDLIRHDVNASIQQTRYDIS